jgi:hypothetical protein
MMGWWAVEKDGKEYLQGDGPYDLIGQAFDKVAQEYLDEWDRKPTLNEILQMVEAILGADLSRYVSDEVTIELVSVLAKTKKRRKPQAYNVGDFFAIPLENRTYTFGRILSDVQNEKMGMLIGIYDFVSRNLVTPSLLRNKPFMFTPFYCSDQGWTTWHWKIIGNAPVVEDEFEYPKFKQGTDSSGWIIVEQDRTYSATAEEVKDLNYAELWSMKSVEWRIQEYLTNR